LNHWQVEGVLSEFPQPEAHIKTVALPLTHVTA
jgi:hypothetical protein